jgi:hypothetical protein
MSTLDRAVLCQTESVGYRTGFVLVQLLTATREMTNAIEVHRHIDAAIAYTTDGTHPGGQRYQRGRPLVNHLAKASKAAAGHGDGIVADRLADFAEYAAGEIPVTVLEARYVPGARESNEEFMRALLEFGLVRCAEILGEFLKDRPDASGQDAHRWLVRVTKAMESWTIGEDRHGGIELPRYAADRLTWFSRIQLVLNGQPEHMAVSAEVADELATMPGAELVARAVRWRRRREALDRLRTVVEDPRSTEREIHTELKQQTWIFGGRYVEELARRRLTTVDEIDIPLLRGDGSLHVIELKKAAVPKLVESLRSHCTVGPDVHRAVSQAANYLRSLDENRAAILADHGIECRRAAATVLIGHPKFVEQGFEAGEIAAALRTYNGVLTRIEVITYQELIDAAERTLALYDEDA